jgi:hypothetical protein
MSGYSRGIFSHTYYRKDEGSRCFHPIIESSSMVHYSAPDKNIGDKEWPYWRKEEE